MQLQKDMPDHHDADLVIKLYELRREPVMRESRSAINRQFWPATAEEALAGYQARRDAAAIPLYEMTLKMASGEVAGLSEAALP